MSERILGIDISVHQGDFPLDVAIAQGVKFVIIKGAGGDCGLYKDGKFERNYLLAKQLKIPVGCYFYSKALDEYTALKEAEFFYENCLKGKSFELPIYYDVEDRTQISLGREKVTNIILKFCDYIKNKGFKVGIYASLYNFNNSFIDSKLENYERWVAQWSTNFNYHGKCGMWQFGGETNFIRNNIIAGQVVDQDYMLYDYLKDKEPEIVEEENKEKMTIEKAVKKVVDIALGEVGYREKASNYMLDDKYANAGDANYTKYARDLDSINWFYNGKKQGFAYCDMFNDWVFGKAFGFELARQMLYQPYYSAGAGCSFSMDYYKANGAFSKIPQVGSQIFFGSYGNVGHTGIVVDVIGDKVYTVEGNTSNGVYKIEYNVHDDRILGYGRPNYALVCDVYEEEDKDEEIIYDSKISSVKDVQHFLNKKYLDCFKTKLDEDDEYGPLTKEALVMSVQKEIGRDIDGIFGYNDKYKFPILKFGAEGSIVKLVQCMLICKKYWIGSDGADGEYGVNTKNAINRFQVRESLFVDGECGPETAYKLFN